MSILYVYKEVGVRRDERRGEKGKKKEKTRGKPDLTSTQYT